MKSLKISSIIFLLLFISCSKEDSSVNPEESISVIAPLKVGNQWTFIDSSFTESGSLERLDTTKLGITGKTTINYNGASIEVFYWNWIDNKSGIPADGKWLARNDEDGLNLYGGRYLSKDFVLGKALAQKYPAKVGDAWEEIRYSYRASDSTFYKVDTISISCVSINQKFNTGKGELQCYVYNYKRTIGSDINDYYLYYAVNQGYVGLLQKKNGIVRFKKTLKTIALSKSAFNENVLNNSNTDKTQYPFGEK